MPVNAYPPLPSATKWISPLGTRDARIERAAAERAVHITPNGLIQLEFPQGNDVMGAAIVRRSPQYPWVILAMAFFAVFGAIGFGRFGYSAVLPAMQGALGLDDRRRRLAGLVDAHRLHHHRRRRRRARLPARSAFVLTVGLAVTTVGMLVTGLSDGLDGASIGRLVTGMGNGMILVPAIGSWPPGSTCAG